MESLVSGSLALVVAITTAVQNVTTLRQRCNTLAAQVLRLQPFLKEVQEQAARSKNRGDKLYSAEAEKQFKALYDALEKANKIVQDLKKTNRVKVVLVAKGITDDLSDVSNDIQVCLSSMSLVGLQVAADHSASLEEAKSQLVKLRDDLKEDSSNKAMQLKELEGKILDAMQRQGSLLSLLHSKEPLQILADHFEAEIDDIKRDLQCLPEFAEWRASSKKASEDFLFEQMLISLGELDRKSCSSCHKTVGRLPDLECPICRGDFTEPVVISSGVTYCKKCIAKAWERDMKCPVSRQVVSSEMFPNRALEGILRVLEVGPHGDRPDDVRSPRPLVSPPRWDLRTSAKEFQSDMPGKRVVGLIALQAHSETVDGKKELISMKNLVSSLVDLTFKPSANTSETKLCLQILDALTSAPKVVGAASSSSGPDELEEVFSILKTRLQDLVALMERGTPGYRVLAAKVMANVIEGSVDCFFIATQTITGLVTAFFEFAVRGCDNSHIGVRGLVLLAGQRYTGDKGQKDEALIRVLMELTRYEIAMEESLVALGKAVVSYKGGQVSVLVEDVSHLVASVSGLPVGDGTKAVIKILRRMAYESGNADAASEHEIVSPFLDIVEAFVPTLLAVVKGGLKENDGRLEGQEGCIMLLGYVCKYGSWRLECEEVPYLFDILLQDEFSNESRLVVLDIFAENAENRQLWRPEVFAGDRVKELLELIKPRLADASLRRGVVHKLCALLTAPIWLEQISRAGGTEALCAVVAIDDDIFCRSHAVIALERLPRTDGMKEVVRTSLSWRQVGKLFQVQGADEETVFEARGAAAALMGILISDAETESSMIEAMTHLVEFLRGNALVCHKQKAVEALVEIICKSGEVAREWVVTSDSNVLDVLVDFVTVSSTDPGWRGKLHESLALLCEDVDCQAAVIKAGGQRLLLESLQAGSQNAAVALAELLVRAEECPGVDLDKVVRAMKVKLQRTKVDPVIVKAFGKLCGTFRTGISVVENGGIEVLLDLIGRSPDCCAAAANALCTLLSVKVSPDLDIDSPPTVKKWRAQVVEHRGVDILLSVAGSRCIEAVEALAAVAEETSAKSRLVERVGRLIEMCLEGDRVQELVLTILMHLSRGSLSQESVSSLVSAGFPAILLNVLRTPALPSATTAVRIVRNLSVESSEFRTIMLSTGEGAVKLLLAVLREPVGLEEIGEYSVLALEMFMKEAVGRQHLVDADGIPLLATVLQQRPVSDQAKFYALKVLLLLSDPPLPRPLRKQVWSSICTSEIFGAVGRGMETIYPNETPLTAVQLLRACVQETSDLSALCKRLKDVRVFGPLARLRTNSNQVLYKEANDLVHVLVKKSNTARKALKDEIDILNNPDDSFYGLAGGTSPSPSLRSHASRE